MDTPKVAKRIIGVKTSDACKAAGDTLVRELAGLATLFDELHIGRSPLPCDIRNYSTFYRSMLTKALNLYWVDTILPPSACPKKCAKSKMFGERVRLRGADALTHQLAMTKRAYDDPDATEKDPKLLKPFKQLKYGLSDENLQLFDALVKSLVRKPTTSGMKKLLDTDASESVPIPDIDGCKDGIEVGTCATASASSSKGGCSALAKTILTIATPCPKPGAKHKLDTQHTADLKSKMAKFFKPKASRAC